MRKRGRLGNARLGARNGGDNGVRVRVRVRDRDRERKVVECYLSSIVLSFLGRFVDIESLKSFVVHSDSGRKARVVIQTLLRDVVHWQIPCPLLAQLLQLRFVHFSPFNFVGKLKN